MQIRKIEITDPMWNSLIEYAEGCSWRAGKSLAKDMGNNKFSEWEGVIIAVEDEEICGYCTVAKTDCIQDVSYTPYIGYIFVDEEYRGNRISQKLIAYAMEYLKATGFENVYIVSDHNNLYEKYGFKVVDRKMAPWGSEEKIYVRRL